MKKLRSMQTSVPPVEIVDAACWWHDWGLDVAPMNPENKHTRLRWNTWLDHLANERHDAIKNEFRASDWLCAIVDHRVFVLDADTPESLEALKALEAEHGLVPNLVVCTTNGEHHYFRRSPETYAKMQGYSSKNHPERIDIRTGRCDDEGRSVIVLPPSPGKRIANNETLCLEDLIEVNQAFIDAVFEHNGEEAPRQPPSRPKDQSRSSVSGTLAADILSHIPPDCDYNEWLTVLMGVHDQFEGGTDGLLLLDQWSEDAHNYCGFEELEYKYRGFTPASEDGVTWASVCKLARKHGADLSAIAKRYDHDGNPWPIYESAETSINKLTNESSPDECEAAVQMTRGLNAIEQHRLLEKIKKQTGVPLGVLKDYLTLDNQYEELSQLAHARATLDHYGDGNLIVASDAFWVYENKGVWREEAPQGIKQRIHQVVPETKITAGYVDAVAKLIQTLAYDRDARFGEPFDGVNVTNGLLVHDGLYFELQPHRKEHYLLSQLPVAYDPTAECPRFRQFLGEIFDGEDDATEKADTLMELIGYTLIPTARYEKFALLVGNGANGKSVLLDVLCALLGPHCIASVSPEKLDNPFQRGYLIGKLANVVTEIAQGAVINDAALKALTSGEPTTAEHKYRAPFTFRPYATCWFATNHMPHTRDFSDALYRRACVIKFNQTFTGKRCDPHLKEKLLGELPGILNMALSAVGWVLAGADFTEPTSMTQARQEWRLEADQVRQFVLSSCELGAFKTPVSAVYAHYKAWADEEGVDRKVKNKTFTNRLRQFEVESVRSGGVRYYRGIRLQTQAPWVDAGSRLS